MANYNVITNQGTEFVPEDISGSQSTTFTITNNSPSAGYFTLETLPPYSTSTPKNTSGSFTLGGGLSGLLQTDYFASVVVAPYTSSTLTFVPAVYISGSTLNIKGTVASPLNDFGNLTRAYISRTKYFSASIESPQSVNNALTSSIFNSASFLFIPSAYSSSIAYSTIPYRGVGDLSFTRTSSGSRFNSSGLVENIGPNLSRLDYSYGSNPALLLEPQRTNLALQSENFDNASWTKQDVTVTANSTTSPDGTSNADTIVASSTTANHDVNQLISITNTVNYSVSAYFKKGTTRYVYIHSQTTGANGFVVFDLDNATFTQQTTYVGSFTSVGSGWYRVTATFTASATTSIRMRWGLTSSSTNPTSALTTSDNVFLFGAQVEAGAYPTTYIPTTSTTVTRTSDSFSRNNIYTNGLISSSGGTWYVELRGNAARVGDAGGHAIILGDTAGTTGNNFRFYNPPTLSRMQIYKTVSTVATPIYTTTTDTVKIAIKWNGTTADIFANGTKVVSATAFTTTAMEYFWVNITGVPEYIQAMALFSTPLSDSDCITLTT